MATIEHLNQSISTMTDDELYSHLNIIRAQRRVRPTKKQKASGPAKTKRSPNKKAPKQQDLFQLGARMTTEKKLALAAELLKLM